MCVGAANDSVSFTKKARNHFRKWITHIENTVFIHHRANQIQRKYLDTQNDVHYCRPQFVERA